jgi:6-phosphogluconolactonase (cycloisomerase 2 family)
MITNLRKALLLVSLTLSLTMLSHSSALAVSLRSQLTAGTLTAGTQLSLPVPSTAPNDVLLAQISVRGGSGNPVTPPAGWTLITRADTNQSDESTTQAVFFHVVTTQPEPTSYTWVFNPGPNDASGGIAAYQGADFKNPIEASASASDSNSSDSSIVAPALNIPASHYVDRLLAFFTISNESLITLPAELTQNWVYHAPGGGIGSALGDIQLTTAGPTTDLVATASQPRPNVGAQVALKPVTPRFTFVANSLDGSGGNSVSAFTINPDSGELSVVGQGAVPAGQSPAALVLDPSGRFLYVANGLGNSVSAYGIDQTTGALAELPGSPFATGSNPSAITVDPLGQFLYVTNRAGNNLSIYHVDSSTGALAQISDSPFRSGKAQSSIAITPSGSFAYVSHPNGLRAYAVDRTNGTLKSLGALAMGGRKPAALTIDPTGRFVYLANSGADSVTAYTINPKGKLKQVVRGRLVTGDGPVSLAVEATGHFLYVANSHSNNISVGAIDQKTGKLTEVSGSPFSTLGEAPTSISIDPSGAFLYVTYGTSNGISCYKIDPESGALAASGDLVPTGGQPSDADTM